MPAARRLRSVFVLVPSLIAMPWLTGCISLPQALSSPTSVAAPGGTGTVDKVRKAYAVQQKLKSLAFSISSDGAGGQLAFIASKDVKKVPISLNVDLAQSPMARAVGVAGLAIPLTSSGPVTFDGPTRAKLAGKGIPPPTIGEIESNLNAAIDAVNTLGA